MPFDLMAGWQNDLAPHWIGKDVIDYELILKNLCLEKNPLYKQKKKEKKNEENALRPIESFEDGMEQDNKLNTNFFQLT
jgi:hypothetical protein